MIKQPITEHLARYLGQLPELQQGPDAWIFPSPRNRTGHTQWIDKAFRRVVVAADLDPRLVTPHGLRHTAISHLVQAGVDLPTVQRISGHKSLEMVLRYAHQNPQHVDEAMQKLERRYRSAPVPITQEIHRKRTAGERETGKQLKDKWARQDLNLRPTDYESAALTS